MPQKNAPSPKAHPGPAHIVWFAPERDGAPWSRIGALWPTKSGKGFRLTLELIPAVPGNLFVLPNEPRETPDGDGA
jgi:hypothetical protein